MQALYQLSYIPVPRIIPHSRGELQPLRQNRLQFIFRLQTMSENLHRPRMLFIAARRGIGAGALAAACAARVAQGGGQAALADLRNRPHPALTHNASAAPFRLANSGGDLRFAENEISIALADSAEKRPQSAVVIFTYAARDLAAARLVAERLENSGANFACVAAHTPPAFPFLHQLRKRAAAALGETRVIEAPEFAPAKLAADSLAGKPCEDPALAHAVDKLAKIADPRCDEEADSHPRNGVNIGEAVAAVRRELADVV